MANGPALALRAGAHLASANMISSRDQRFWSRTEEGDGLTMDALPRGAGGRRRMRVSMGHDPWSRACPTARRPAGWLPGGGAVGPVADAGGRDRAAGAGAGRGHPAGVPHLLQGRPRVALHRVDLEQGLLDVDPDLGPWMDRRSLGGNDLSDVAGPGEWTFMGRPDPQ